MASRGALLKQRALLTEQTHPLRPIIRAYVFGHVSSTGPRLVGAILAFISKHRSLNRLVNKISGLLLQSLSTDKFPYFCAYLVGLNQVIKTALISVVTRSSHLNDLRKAQLIRLCIFAAAASASWISLPLLNAPKPTSHQDEPQSSHLSANGNVDVNNNAIGNGTSKPKTTHFHQSRPAAGKTLDLTVLASTRALETLIHQTWRRRVSQHLNPSLRNTIATTADPLLFILSAGVIMWNWIYHPSRLPPSYNKWISSAAAVDKRLIEVLRSARGGTFVYGKHTGPANSILRSMCIEHGWPEAWGDPEFVPDGIPCEIVHSGAGPSCHIHAVWRFARAFRFGLAMYLPLQLLLKFRSKPTNNAASKLVAALREACQSAAFLGGFVGAFYYAVCLARTLVGPKVFSKHTVTSQMWDSGLCVGAGSAACGWSVFVEQAKRRPELALFVAPKALAAYLPRRYDRREFWKERTAFAVSMGALFAAAAEGPNGVRGVVGTLLHGVLY